ncbi:hypothetical protein ACWEPL_64810 [Nonomuraea sp. NPDC004186]
MIVAHGMRHLRDPSPPTRAVPTRHTLPAALVVEDIGRFLYQATKTYSLSWH